MSRCKRKQVSGNFVYNFTQGIVGSLLYLLELCKPTCGIKVRNRNAQHRLSVTNATVLGGVIMFCALSLFA